MASLECCVTGNAVADDYVKMIYDGDDDDIADKDDVQVPPCDLLAGQQHNKCSCCATSSSL